MDNIITFSKPIHLVCSPDELRPSMSYIYFKDEYAWATNACVMIKFDLRDCDMDTEQCSVFSGKAIHMNLFKDILYKRKLLIKDKKLYQLYNDKAIRISDDIFDKDITNKMQSTLEELLDKHKSSFKQDVDSIGIDFKLIKIISSVFPSRLKLSFSGKDKGIIISGEEYTRTEGVIMPYKINS